MTEGVTNRLPASSDRIKYIEWPNDISESLSGQLLHLVFLGTVLNFLKSWPASDINNLKAISRAIYSTHVFRV